ncbi:beta-galactosidase GalB [Anditalea andensis]|uniref:Glycoside hydrolase n=1 Tax=Anditalea andensis TaxID=1048983 RepID=A0A074KZF8_9BACT|nr:beta-galactosidase GalB [Anditalea andensis]KEO74304.1 glycoside hydrolase [Anditalea andensis]
MAKPILIIAALLLFFSSCQQQKQANRQQLDFNKCWHFQLGDHPDAVDMEYDSESWRKLTLPHDWSIEGEFSKEHPTTPEGGALPAGMGWYRKTFSLPESDSFKTVWIEFDGIYRNSEIWINGHYLGIRPNGYSSFQHELSPHLNYGEEANVIAVKVDNSQQPNSRWYTGSGIYRNVRLIKTGKVHVDHWGTFITTPKITESSSNINLQLTIKNQSNENRQVRVLTTILDGDNNKVASMESDHQMENDSTLTFDQNLDLADPVLWDVDRPYMYSALTQIYDGNELLDDYRTPFGIRYFDFHPEKGFSLNGKPMKILGVCNHHDLGALGAAVNERAIERQLEILKEMGVNAIRTAHNPPAPELLDLCDRMGFIVQDEAFDEWKKRKAKEGYHKDWDEWHKQDLEDMIRRDRNHPSIFMWSIGNEIREQFDSTGITITRELVSIVKNLDTTRPVTCALTENEPDKNFIYQSGALDLLGFNYKHRDYEKFPEWYPGEKLIATENMSALATRGEYFFPSDSIMRWPEAHDKPLVTGKDDYTVSAFDQVSAYWGSTHEETWTTIKNQDFMSGLFVWTGFDYLGEPIPYPYPARSSYFGIIDLAGFPKDAFYMYKSEWTNTPTLHLFPHWNWEEGKEVDVWAYYNQADEVELFLNDKSVGKRKKEGDDLNVMWRLPYEKGTIRAVSRKDGKTVLEREIQTAGKAAKIHLEADRSDIKADGKDLSFITVSIRDKNGNIVPNADDLVTFEVEGNGFIAGVDNGYQASLEPFKANYRKAFRGKCLVIVQATENPGPITLKANAEGISSSEITVNVQ